MSEAFQAQHGASLARIAARTDLLTAGDVSRPKAFERHFREECGMPDGVEFQWGAQYMVAALDGWNAHVRQSQATDVEARRERVARAICSGCGEHPDHQGDARGNAYRWQDYLDAADAAISAI